MTFVLNNIWTPSLLYTYQVLLFLHSTARSADILNPGNLAIIPQHINMVRFFLVHKLSIVNRDPDEIKAIYIHYAGQSSVSTFKKEVVHNLSIVNRDPDEIKARYIQYAGQSSVSTFKKEVDEYCRHLWQREIQQGLMFSNYSGLKVRNSIIKMLAPYPRKVSVKTLRVLMNDFEVREVLFRSKKSKSDICPYCRVVDDTAHFLFSCVSYQEHLMKFMGGRK